MSALRQKRHSAQVGPMSALRCHKRTFISDLLEAWRISDRNKQDFHKAKDGVFLDGKRATSQ
jgi:hypothetical protein